MPYFPRSSQCFILLRSKAVLMSGLAFIFLTISKKALAPLIWAEIEERFTESKALGSLAVPKLASYY